MRAQQLGLDAQDVAVAAAEMVHRLNAGVPLDELAGDLRAHAGAGARPIRHVDAIDARLGAELGAGDFLGGVHPARRQDLHESHELPRGQLGAQLRFVGHRHFRDSLRFGLGLLDGDAQLLLHRLQRARLGVDQLDVLGRRPAASAHDAHARPEQPPRILRHVFRRAQIEVAAFHAHRNARVRHGADGLGGECHHALDGIERGLRAHGAIDPDDIRRPFVETPREGFRFRATGQVPVIVDGHLRHDGHLRTGRFARGEQCLAHFVQIAEGFEHQQIDAGLQQHFRLLAEDGARLGERSRSQRLDVRAERADSAGHESVLAGRFTGQADAGMVDGMQFLGEPERRQAHAVGPEGVGLQDLGAGLHVLLMNLPHHVGRGDVQLIEAAVDEHAARIKHGAHGAVGHHGAAGKLLSKLFGAGSGGGRHGEDIRICYSVAADADIVILPHVGHRERAEDARAFAAHRFPRKGSPCWRIGCVIVRRQLVN